MSYTAKPKTQLQQVFTWFPFDAAVKNWSVVAGTWTAAAGTSTTKRNNLSSNKTQNEEVYIGNFSLGTARTLECVIECRTNNDCGVIHVLLDGTDKGTVDTYSAGLTEVVKKTVSLGAIAAGSYAVTLKMATKNAASTDYEVYVESVTIYEAS